MGLNDSLLQSFRWSAAGSEVMVGTVDVESVDFLLEDHSPTRTAVVMDQLEVRVAVRTLWIGFGIGKFGLLRCGVFDDIKQLAGLLQVRGPFATVVTAIAS